MTSEDLKILHPMREVVESYSIQIDRNGFCMCPFHQDNKTASFKVYEDSFHCFGCNANGDIFTFVQMMDDVDFKTAFKTLGGEYEHSFAAKRRIEKLKRKRALKLKLQAQKRFEISLCGKLISIYRKYIDMYEPFSDEWCQCMNALQKQLAEYEFLIDLG